MSDFDRVVEKYLAAWNTTDPAARRAAVDEVFTEDVRFVDPFVAVEGRDAVDAVIAGIQERFPGMVFGRGGPVDAHHDQGRFTWTMGAPDEEPPVVGFDVAELAGDGRISRIYGFIDKAPAL
jgi:hypothetical protein